MAITTMPYSAARLALLSRVYWATTTQPPKYISYQTADGVPSHLIINGRAATEATNKVFRLLVERHCLNAVDGQVILTEDGEWNAGWWRSRYGGRDRAKIAEFVAKMTG